MVSFVSLFLGLVVGYQTVELKVAEPVARVEILLDGEEVASFEAPDWRGQIDFGQELRPHELTAVAFDVGGTELDRTRQWINLPRPPADTTILLELDPRTGRRIANVSWTSLTGDEPSAVRVDLDGSLLEFEDPRAIPLPDYDPEQLHYLRVELEFAGFVSTAAEITFGGFYTDHVDTELTAIPIVPSGRKKLPPAEELQDGFRAHGKPLRLAALEKGKAELIVVRDQDAWPALRNIRRQALSSPHFSAGSGAAGLPQWLVSDRAGWASWSFRFLWPASRRQVSSTGTHDLFTHSAKYSAESGSLHGWLTTLEQPAAWAGAQRMADAVAVAGVTVAGSNRRRGVLLVLAGPSPDASEAAPATIRRYLESLAVPLFVWSVDPAYTDSVWGPAEDVSSARHMSRATREIFKALESQRIAWLEGIHLPEQITVAPSLESVETLTGQGKVGRR